MDKSFQCEGRRLDFFTVVVTTKWGLIIDMWRDGFSEEAAIDRSHVFPRQLRTRDDHDEDVQFR
jgi:hypothetical protein